MSEANKRPLYIPYAGPTLLEMPLLNKDCAFTPQERIGLNLIGLLPQNIETIEEQAQRAYKQFQGCETPLDKHIYLRDIQDNNETLFFRLIEEHIEEMLPIIYTPTVGDACQRFSEIYRSHRGLFISYPDREHMDDILWSATKGNVRVIVATDGERILGLGDQGIGGMGIPIGKLSLYTACGGVSPAYTLPIVLDVGTNNPDLLNDPMYMGWRHERITGEAYDEFVEAFVQAVKRRWPRALLQFEDFAQHNAYPLLDRYRDKICCFNDDIQGTAAICTGTLLAACKAKNEKVSDQTIVFAGAGSAGCGIAEQIVATMVKEGLPEAEARQRIYLINSRGLVTEDMPRLFRFQQPLAQKKDNIAGWSGDPNGSDALKTVVTNARPTILIGVAGRPGLFTQDIVELMAANNAQPIIMPLSNPTSRAEATPEQVLNWTNGSALVATGSPFDPVAVNGRSIPIAQCNNSYIFPGVGLGVIAANAKKVTDTMLMAASEALAECSPILQTGQGALLPPMAQIREVSKAIGFAVAKQAQEDGVALKSSDEAIRESVDRNFWFPRYRQYRRATI